MRKLMITICGLCLTQSGLGQQADALPQTADQPSPRRLTPPKSKFLSKTKDSYLESVPVGRWGAREEVAEAVRFFAEEHSGFLTGQTLAVNGGRTLL